ncbi:MAG TPA: hypothetical protein VLL98_05365 [Rickettsiales bacterium]|nr:hypothetical protein [Rickettsiales bacterium]
MKKILTTAFVIGSLYGTAHAAVITSPIYMPTSGEAISTLDVGYTKSSFDKANNTTSNLAIEDEFEKSWNLNMDGKYGLNDSMSLNYGFDFDFNREMEKLDQSAKLTNVYVGLTGRVVDADANKLDILFNVGQQAEKYWLEYANDQMFADLAVRYGLDLDSYNMALSFGSKYTSEWKNDTAKIDDEFNFFAKLENEFIFTDSLTMGIDLFYTYNPKNTYNDGVDKQSYKSFSEYGLNIDLNYALNDNNYLGIYFGMTDNDIDQDFINDDGDTLNYKDLTEYNGGVRLTTRF